MAETIQIFYKCKCMSVEVALDIPYRREDEDIRDWMHNCVTAAIALDHRRRSPDCRRDSMEYAKIPAPNNAPFVGGKPVVN